MQYFIWDFTACKSKHLELSVIIQEGLEGYIIQEGLEGGGV